MHRDGNRTHRVASSLQRDLTQLIHEVYPHLFEKLFSITHIKVSPDLAVAHVYCSCLESVDTQIQPLVDELQADTKQIRYQLARTSPMRKFPALRFHPDEVQFSSHRIDSLLRKVQSSQAS